MSNALHAGNWHQRMPASLWNKTDWKCIMRQTWPLADAAVVDNSIVLTVYPGNDLPRRLFDMVLRLDMVFAACP